MPTLGTGPCREPVRWRKPLEHRPAVGGKTGVRGRHAVEPTAETRKRSTSGQQRESDQSQMRPTPAPRTRHSCRLHRSSQSKPARRARFGMRSTASMRQRSCSQQPIFFRRVSGFTDDLRPAVFGAGRSAQNSQAPADASAVAAKTEARAAAEGLSRPPGSVRRRTMGRRSGI